MFLYSVELLLCLLMTLNDFLARVGEESYYLPLEGKLSWQQVHTAVSTGDRHTQPGV